MSKPNTKELEMTLQFVLLTRKTFYENLAQDTTDIQELFFQEVLLVISLCVSLYCS